MPHPRLARANKPVARGGHVEVYRDPGSRKYSPTPREIEPRRDYNPETHGQCNVCGDIVCKRKDGTLYTHRTYCLGSPIPYTYQYKPKWDERPKNNSTPRVNPIRVWAKERGYAITAQGRIPDSIRYAYEKAHQNNDD